MACTLNSRPMSLMGEGGLAISTMKPAVGVGVGTPRHTAWFGGGGVAVGRADGGGVGDALGTAVGVDIESGWGVGVGAAADTLVGVRTGVRVGVAGTTNSAGVAVGAGGAAKMVSAGVGIAVGEPLSV